MLCTGADVVDVGCEAACCAAVLKTTVSPEADAGVADVVGEDEVVALELLLDVTCLTIAAGTVWSVCDGEAIDKLMVFVVL